MKREAQWGSMGCQEPQPHRQPEGPRPTEQPQRGMPVAPMAVSAEVWLWLCSHPVFERSSLGLERHK